MHQSCQQLALSQVESATPSNFPDASFLVLRWQIQFSRSGSIARLCASTSSPCAANSRRVLPTAGDSRLRFLTLQAKVLEFLLGAGSKQRAHGPVRLSSWKSRRSPEANAAWLFACHALSLASTAATGAITCARFCSRAAAFAEARHWKLAKPHCGQRSVNWRRIRALQVARGERE